MMKNSFFSLLFFAGLLGAVFGEEKAGHYEVTYEVFSLPMAEAAKLRREKLGGVKSHARLLDRVKKGEVTQEKWMVLKVSEVDRWITEAVEEFVYGTEYSGDGLSGGSLVPSSGYYPSSSPLNFLLPLVPPQFDSKYLGDVFECAVEGAEVQMSATHIRHLKNDSFGKGVSEWVMPRFAVQKIRTTVEVVFGKPALVGTISPPGELQDEEEKRVWLAFVTVVEL